jgi:RNA ligase
MQITNINQLLPLVVQKPEFVILDRGDYQVIDYVYQDQDTFEHPELMECRGIKFCRDGLILARPFRKFFNFGERGSDLPLHREHIITTKLDGSMIHPVLIANKHLFLHTRKGHTDVAKQAERYMLSCDISYVRFCKAMLRGGWTPIFEYIGPNNRIVLRYEWEDMILLALRHTVEGHIMSYKTMSVMAAQYHVPVVENLGAIQDRDAFVKGARNLEDAEGYVVYYTDGYMVKIKAEDYVMKHRALDDMSSKKKVVALCTQGFMDDVLPVLSQEDTAELVQFNHDLQTEITKLVTVAKAFARDWACRRKDFALEVAPDIRPKWLAGVVFGVMDGKDARMLVLKAVERGGYEDIGTEWRGE